jgi:hypothetical protein
MMKKSLIPITLSLLLSSCSKDESKSSDMETSKNDMPESNLVDYSKIPKVEIVRKIDAIIQQSINEGWSKEEWVQRFGAPRRSNSYKGDLEFIQYYDSGPFEDSSKELVTGITIKLRKDKTFDYSYRTTSFGLPEYVK